MSLRCFLSISLPMCVIHSYLLWGIFGLRKSEDLSRTKGFLELSPSIVKEKQFPLVFLLLLIWSISLDGRCCIPLFTVQFYSMNARVERVCRNETREGGTRVDKWVGLWEVPTLFPEYRVSLVISRYLFNKHSSLCNSCLKFETSL